MRPLSELIESFCEKYDRRPWFWLFGGFLASCLMLGLSIDVGSWTIGFPSVGLMIATIGIAIQKNQ